MLKLLFRALIVGAAFVLSFAVDAQAQAPTPAPKPTPSPFTYGGYVRAYYFTRTNTSSNQAKPYNYINQAAENQAVDLHAAYDFGGGFSVGGTYLYADPLNGCSEPITHLAGHGNCSKKSAPGSAAAGATFNRTTYDDTLPDYRLSTLYEGYLQYKEPAFTAWAGQRVINTPWANASDSRLKPVSFRGADAALTLGKQWQVEAGDYISWEDRVQSDFTRTTILTQNGSYPDAGGQGTTGIPSGGYITNNGFIYGRLGYAAGAATANAYVYAFNNIANALWFDAKFTAKTAVKPFIAFQGGTESNAGSALAGKIDSQVFGVQIGVTPIKNVDFTVGYDDIPQKSDSITLPGGVKCTNHLIAGTSPATPLQYFLPASGTPNCFTATPGVAGAPATIYYGGWASPYTDSYATDQLFTTSISQGMVDRRSPGDAVKVASTINLDRKQIRIILAQAWYTYGNATTGYANTRETNIDGTYFFSKVPAAGPYHGFSIRHRYADRETPPTFGGLPVFKYNRTQLEYDF